MTLPVHLVEDLRTVRVGDPLEVSGDEAHHAVAVRRLQTGERVMLCDGAGRRATGEIVSTGKRRMVVQISDVADEPRPTPEFTVVQGLPKGERGELAVEMLTEIGVSGVVPWAASRSVAVWRGERAVKSLAKWRSTAREAAKQARRSWFPEVHDLASTAQIADRIAAADLALVLHEDATETLAALGTATSILLVVGPEGGISAEELETFVAAGARPVRLGAEVLRTSTAGVAAVSALLAQTPRWGAVVSAPESTG